MIYTLAGPYDIFSTATLYVSASDNWESAFLAMNKLLE